MTIRMTARFTVRGDGVGPALAAIERFVAHTRTEPGTLRYESWRSAERPREFVHLMEFADEAAQEAHASSDAVGAFTDVLYPLCEEPPSFDRWEAIGRSR
jgi:quinol monooxygenase YgiN